jgi:serine phosphatase RsbU (regulator of sigma subunit)
LWKNTEQEPMYDGMNISLCSYDVKLKILEYSGAYNPFYIVRQKSIIKLEPDRMPIGVHIYDKPFSVHKIQLEKKDRVYLFTDGYVDQIGGLDNKKLKRTGFKDLLLSIQGRSIQKQAHKIEQFFNTWKQHNDQTDDVTVIGFEVD